MEPSNDAIQIKRFDPSMPLPEYKTPGAAAFDLSSRLDVVIPARSHAKVPLGVAIKLPEGYWAMLAVRSSLHKKGLMPLNGIGVIDQDYSGDNDEYMSVLYNFSDQEATIEKGERVAQVVVLPYSQFEIVGVEKLEGADRGGFGSTGHK